MTKILIEKILCLFSGIDIEHSSKILIQHLIKKLVNLNLKNVYNLPWTWSFPFSVSSSTKEGLNSFQYFASGVQEVDPFLIFNKISYFCL